MPITTLNLRLLGEYQLHDAAGSPITLSAKKSWALLAYLGIRLGSSASRVEIAQLLWSHTDTEFGKSNLRQLLSVLRRAMHHHDRPVLVNHGSTLRLEPAVIWIDVVEFEQATDADDSGILEHGASLYQGEFLAGFPAVDDAFDEWLAIQRARLRQRFINTLQKLLERYDTPQNQPKVERFASRLLQTDPANEYAHRAMMRWHWRQGDRQSAIRQYQSCLDTLQLQLNIEPSQTTRTLHESILQSPPDSQSEFSAINRRAVEFVPEEHTAKADHLVSDLESDSPGASRITHRFTFPAEIATSPDTSEQVRPTLRSQCRRWFALKWTRRHRLPAAVLSALLLSCLLIVKQFWTTDPSTPVSANRLIASSTGGGESPESIAALPQFPLEQAQPSIAVMPFNNISEDTADLYFSDGLSEDINTELSRITGLTVLASHSSFALRDKQNDLNALQDLLPADYLLSGSVRRVNGTVRVTARLIRLRDSVNVWSTRIDKPLDDILAVQDEITRSIVGSLSVELTHTEWQRLSGNRVVSPEAYDLLLRGLHPFSQFTETGINQARAYFRQSIELDNSYARPYANMALSYGREVVFQLEPHDPQSIRKGLEYADKAESLDPSLPQTQFARAVLSLANRDHRQALIAAHKSISLDKNYADGFAVLAQTSAYTGALDVALEAIHEAKALNPIVPFMYYWVEGHILYLLGRYIDAQRVLTRVYERNPTFYSGLVLLAATHGQLEQTEEAEWLREEILVIRPSFSWQEHSASAPYATEQLRNLLSAGMQKAGLPE